MTDNPYITENISPHDVLMDWVKVTSVVAYINAARRMVTYDMRSDDRYVTCYVRGQLQALVNAIHRNKDDYHCEATRGLIIALAGEANSARDLKIGCDEFLTILQKLKTDHTDKVIGWIEDVQTDRKECEDEA